MEDIVETLTCIQDEIELVKDEIIVQEPKKSLCETWKDNFLTFWKKNIKLE
jgi:hypothetical protein